MDEYRGRKSLDLELLEVETKINVLYRLVKTAFNDCMESFYEKDLALSKKVIEEDEKINVLSKEIENLSILVIRNQTPIASDIRKLFLVSDETPTNDPILSSTKDILVGIDFNNCSCFSKLSFEE